MWFGVHPKLLTRRKQARQQAVSVFATTIKEEKIMFYSVSLLLLAGLCFLDGEVVLALMCIIGVLLDVALELISVICDQSRTGGQRS